ncbi:RNA-binding protein [Opitutaceae bacterium EW11]|nr:RNA-binding protein [Opitutaceae bacterium EW11]
MPPLELRVFPAQSPSFALLRTCIFAFAASLAGLSAALGAPPAASARLISDSPLAPRSGPRGSTLFTPLPPEQTGLVTENAYADPRMWGDLFPEFYLGAIGTGLAVGDFDNDGRPDLFVVSKTGVCRLFRNLGGWKFEDVTEKAGLLPSGSAWERGLAWLKRTTGSARAADELQPWKQGATFADVNNDGWLDLYVCRYNAPNQLFINQGDGTFKEEAAARGVAVLDASGAAAFCDYDRDGWLDLFVQTNVLSSSARPNGQRDYLFHNYGDGTFTDVTDRADIRGDAHGHSVDWWDYNQDGWPDIYVANDFAVPDVLYHNNGDGTFTDVIQRTVPHMPFSSMGSDQGDINNDGLPDLLVADMAATTHEKDQRSMVFARGMSDEAARNAPAVPQYSRSALYLNTGTGRMLEAAQLAGVQATDWTWTVRFEDLDNDGWLDLFFTNGMVREFHNNDLLDRVMRAESEAERVRVVQLTPLLAERHLAYRNCGDLRFEDVGAAWGLDQKGVSFGSVLADFDGDGDLDLVYANYQGGVSVFRNDSDSGHRIVLDLHGTRSNRFGVGATARVESSLGTQVRTLVLTRGYLSSSGTELHFGLGRDETIDRLTISWPSGVVQQFQGLAADRRYTITEPSGSAKLPPAVPAACGSPGSSQFEDASRRLHAEVTVNESKADEVARQPFLPLSQNGRGPAAAVGDVDGDGREDLVVGGSPKDPARLLRNQSAGGFSTPEPLPVSYPGGLPDGPLLLIDANGDGSLDLLVSKTGDSPAAKPDDYALTLLINDGRGHFAPAQPGSVPLTANVGALAAADFDRDGRLDVFVGSRGIPGLYPEAGDNALLANRGGGRFENVSTLLAPMLRRSGIVNSALWSDVDGDGYPDLILAIEWGSVMCFHNDEGRGFTDWTERLGFSRAGTGWWTSLAAADFNGDGRPDYVAGNLGLNTRYQASPTHPALLFLGKFGTRTPLAIEAYYEDDKLYPWRSRRDLGAQIPSVLRRFRETNSYARATLGEILGEEALASAERFAATEFRSGVFLSQPDGTYRFVAFPRVVQVAPLQGMVAGDFDGDGCADVFAVQNSFASLSYAGRFDGGLGQLLRGDGRGGLFPVPVGESGLCVSGDAKALVALDVDADGGADFFATRNGGSSILYRNRAPSGAGFGVTLQGPKGNPTGVGSLVVLELSDGSRQTVEVYAGSSYMSQSSARCWFGVPRALQPRRLRVRWSDGAETVRDVAPGATSATVQASR